MPDPLPATRVDEDDALTQAVLAANREPFPGTIAVEVGHETARTGGRRNDGKSD